MIKIIEIIYFDKINFSFKHNEFPSTNTEQTAALQVYLYLPLSFPVASLIDQVPIIDVTLYYYNILMVLENQP